MNFKKIAKLVSWQKGSSKKSLWIDQKGMPIERFRVKKAEATNERATKGIFNEALKIAKLLQDLRGKIDEAMKHCYVVFLTEEGEVIPEGDMPGFTLHNFNRSVKIVREAKNLTQWDPNFMQVALERFEKFFDSNLTMFQEDKMSVMRDMILATFKDKGGRFDNRQVGDILKYRNHPSVEDDEDFQSAITAIEEAKGKGNTVYYDRIYVWDNGSWKEVQLNFSKVEIYDEDEEDGQGEV